MKTKIIFIALSAILISSCTFPGYLPSSDAIDINRYGSQIKIIPMSGPVIQGELIAVDNNNLIILTDSVMNKKTGKIMNITPRVNVKHFKLQYAKSKNYWWSVPLLTAATASHGLYFIFSAPVNLLVTGLVTATGISDFQYNEKKITYDDLNMFARFPQGIPENVNVASIK